MKHLKKFNESLENKQEIIDYIKLCFIEFYDRPGNIVEDEEYNDGESITFQLAIDEPDLLGKDYDKNINNFVKNSQEIVEFYLEIENCLEKVKIRYDLKVKFEYQWPPEGHITIIFVLEGTGDIKDDEDGWGDTNWIN